MKVPFAAGVFLWTWEYFTEGWQLTRASQRLGPLRSILYLLPRRYHRGHFQSFERRDQELLWVPCTFSSRRCCFPSPQEAPQLPQVGQPLWDGLRGCCRRRCSGSSQRCRRRRRRRRCENIVHGRLVLSDFVWRAWLFLMVLRFRQSSFPVFHTSRC